MKRNTLLSRFMAAVLSLAMVAVFMPALGYVDKAYADDKTVTKMEIITTVGYKVPLDDPDLTYLESNYEEGKEDFFRVTYDDDTHIDFKCVDENWNFENEDGDTVMIIVDEWEDEPDDFTDGEEYNATLFVYSVPSGLGINRGDYLTPIKVTVGEGAKSVSDLSLELTNPLVIPEKASGSYDDEDITINTGDKLKIVYSDSSTEVFTADSDPDNHKIHVFYNESGDSVVLYFAWWDEANPDNDPDNNPAITKAAGETAEAKIFVKSQLDSGSWICGTTRTSVKIADHTPGEAVRENEVPATCSVEGSYDEVVKCTVCGEEISRTPKTIDKTAHTPGEAVRENEVPATEQAEGHYDEVVKCTVCSEEISRTQKTIPKLTPASAPTSTPASGPATLNSPTVNAAAVQQALKAAGGSSDTFVLGKSVKKISKGAFAGTGVKTLVVTSKKLKKKSVKGSLKGSSVKTVKVKVGKAKLNKKYVKKYKKIFTKKNCGKKVKVRKF